MHLAAAATSAVVVAAAPVARVARAALTTHMTWRPHTWQPQPFSGLAPSSPTLVSSHDILFRNALHRAEDFWLLRLFSFVK